MNVIFLDIDGVMRTNTSDKFWYGENIPISIFDRKFCQISINMLNEVVKQTQSKIIISSTWREQYTLLELNNIFKNNGFKYQIYDKTDKLNSRGEEIQQWLDTHEVNKYVVIDDSIKDITKHINQKKIIKCDTNIGLSEDKFILILNALI